MRITSGILRNRRFEIPEKEVRPTMESVREALFSSLGGSCNNWSFLDLYAGSGSVGLEAWSRGATHVTFIEKDIHIANKLEKTISNMDSDELGSTEVIHADVLHGIRTYKNRYDVIFADPPYDLENALIGTLDIINKSSVLADNGRVVYELRRKQEVALPLGWLILRDKCYGKTRMLILKKECK